MPASQNVQKFGLRIHDISCTGLPRTGRFMKHPASFYLIADIAGMSRRTSIKERSNDPSWSDSLNFDVEGGNLMIQVMTRHRSGETKLVAELISPITIVPDFENSQKILEQPLVRKTDTNAGTVTFTLTRTKYPDASETERVQMELADAGANKVKKKNKLENGVGAILKSAAVAGKAKGTYGIWKALSDKVEIVVRIGNEIAEISPYAHMAWSVLSPALKAVAEQKKRDDRISHLLDSMKDMYDFVDTTKPIRVEDLGRSRQEIIKRMLQQTYDCAWFIRGYTSRGFFGRSLEGMMGNHDSIVEQYTAKFGELKTKFQEKGSVAVEITVHRTLFVAEAIAAHQVLKDMKCATELDRPNECLPGTRDAILSEISDWVNRPPKEENRCAYWLHGVAGCGKSAIASTIVQRFRAMKRCASYFFDASKQSESGPGRLFSTLSRVLADLDPHWRTSLVSIAEESWELRTTTNVKEQFENFIIRPAQDFRPAGPILIVIDALDESGDKKGRALLLQMLGRLKEIGRHRHFRFLITSRDEEDIVNTFAAKSWVLSKDLNNVDEASTDDDIRRYISQELSQEPALTQMTDEKPVDLLVSRAGHLFQWAFVACTFILGVGESGVNPIERYIHVRDDPTDSQLGYLDQLYTTVLRNLYGSEKNNDKIRRFRKVLGRILSAREPLSLYALTKLRADDEDEHEMDRIVCSLGSLLRGVDNRREPIQPIHTSFIDFLSDPSRSGYFHVIAGSEDIVLAKSSLRVMSELLHFNMCNLESSYVRNRDIKDLSMRVHKNIPEHLSYACRYFAEHLDGQEGDTDILTMIHNFLSTKLLFWLEAMSVLGVILQSLTELLTLQTWTEKHSLEEELKSFVADAVRFVRGYGGAMETSAPHIYLSCMAFIPLDSLFHKNYKAQYPGMFKVALDDKRAIKWTSILLQIQVLARVRSIDFSPDGKFVVSGSEDSTVRVWDALTGKLVTDPFQGHAGIVNSVRFSPNGKFIVSGSDDSTVRIWDVHTGMLVGRPFKGHDSKVRSVRFSPNSDLVVSSSNDSTIRVWDARTGKLVSSPFRGHTGRVRSVGFSPDGKLLVSGSEDKTIRVWNAWTGTLVAGPFNSHSSGVTSVSFSPDGTLIVSGSSSSNIRVCDARTGEPVSGPFKGHISIVRSVGFSPNGKLIVSGSDDLTVRVWHTHTGKLAAGPFRGHAGAVNSVGFSPDGKLVVSSSTDFTIRVWDVQASKQAAYSFEDYINRISSIEFSPDSELIICGYEDSMVRVWDARTGRLVVNPLKGHTRKVWSVGLSPNGEFIASGSEDLTVRVWNARAGKLVSGPFKGHTGIVRSVSFSPDGKLVVSGSDDKTIRVWDVRTGKLVAGPFKGSSSSILSVGFSPNGKLIASGSSGMNVRVRDSRTGKLVAGPFHGHTKAINSVVFSPDGKNIVSASDDSDVRVYDSRTGELVAGPLQGHSRPVTSVGFSPDGKLILSGSRDSTIRVWDARTGGLVAGPFRGHTSAVNSAKFSPDGRLIASGSNDSTIRVWDIRSFTSPPSEKNPTHPLLIHGADDSPDVQTSNSTQQLSHSSRSFVLYSDLSEMNGDGWMLGPSGELLFWIPPAYRTHLWRPSNTLIIGLKPLRIDFTRFTHGTDWHRCYVP